MQERRVVISRVIKSARVLPQTKETPKERIARFVDAQKQVVAYPFSPELSVKALGAPLKNSKDPSADNKAKRKKAKSKFLRVGKAIFDPDAKPRKGQYFEIRPRAINQDGQLGDVPNVGWLDPNKIIAPKDLVNYAKSTIAKRGGVNVRKVPARKNPRTGAMEVKALGTTIGRAAGNIGQAAARAVGIVVDGDGKFRCPPGVPAANQFTDEVGSNCFDFSPLVARALVSIAQKFGQETMQQLTSINNASPFERDGDYRLVPRGSSLRSSGGRLRGTILGSDDGASRLRGSLLGPDGKPISTESIDAEEARAVDLELAAAERDLARIPFSGEVVDPTTYEEKFEEALREAYPELSAAEIKQMAKLAADRERMKDKLRQEQRDALAVVRSLGISVNEADPASVQRGLALALHKMKEMGWDVDLDSYFGEGFADNPEVALLAHRRNLAELSALGVFDAISIGKIDGLSQADVAALEKKYGKKLAETLINAIVDGKNPSEVFPDDDKAQTLLAVMQNSMSKARQYETGLLMQLVNARDKTPELTNDIKVIAHVDAGDDRVDDPYFAEMQVLEDGSGLFLGINIHGMLMTHPAESLKDSDNFLYEPTGTAGTEIEKLKRIGEVVTAENRKKLLGSYFDDLKSFGSQIDQLKKGEGYMNAPINSSFGGIALGQFVAIHELTHGRQLSLAKEVILSRNPNMTNSEAFQLAWKMVLGRTLRTPDGQDFDYGTMMSDPNVLRTAVSNMSDIIGFLTANQVGGTYGPSHYYATFYLNEAFRQINGVSDLAVMRNELYRRLSTLEPDSAEHRGLSEAIKNIDKVLKTSKEDIDAVMDMKKRVDFMAQLTYLEMQADLNAAVRVGLIEETPEIKAFLAPLSLDQDLPDLRRNIVPPAPPGPPPTKKEKLRRLARVAKTPKRSITEIIENALDDALAGYSPEDRGLMSSGLASSVRFDSRGAASRWGKQVRDAVLLDATDRQIEIVENAEWRLMHDIKIPVSRDGDINEPKMRHRLLMGGIGDQWMADEIENGFIPFVEVVGDSKLPNSVAAEIVVPSEILGFPGENTQGRRFEIGTHFTGVIKDNESLGSAGGVVNQADGQRLIIAVPEGSSGLPDYTPGTNKSEVGSLILPPGEIEVVGVREDGVAIGRVISQRSVDDIIDAKRQELRAFDEKLDDVGEKITVRKAVNRLERRQGVRSLAALRSSSATNDALPDVDTTKIPAEKSPRTRDILERLNARGIKFGKSKKQDRERKRNEKLEQLKVQNAGTFSVKLDSHDFETPEEASVRVSQQIDRATELIKDGKLAGLAPEVAEIMKEKSPEEIKQILAESARSFVDGLDKRPRFRIRGTKVRDVSDAREIPLLGFLKTGVYKTTYDADEVGVAAASDVATRSEYEIMLGIPEDADDSIRPAHGFFTHKDQAEFEEQWKKIQLDEAEKREPNAVSFRDPSVLPPASGSGNKLKDSDGKLRSVDALPYQYGDSEIVLRTDAASRSVGTMGDSLNGMRTPFELDGSSTDDELLESFVLNRGKAFEQSGSGGAVSPSSQRRIANLLNANIGKNHSQTTDWTEDGGFPQREYVEAIVAGSFDMSDVEEIRISPEFQDANTKVSSVKANEIEESHLHELLSDVLPSQDVAAASKLISESQSDPQAKRAATAVRDLIAARLSLVRERSSRRDIRRQVAQRSSEGNVPKVTFLNRSGINIDDHRTFKRTMDAMDMTEEHEIDDIVKYGTARAIREQLSGAGIAKSPDESFAAMKPKPTREPRASLRSSGATRSRDDLLREILVPTSPRQEPIGSRSLQMMDEARNRREELSRILDAARLPDNYFEQYELEKALEMADKPLAHLDDEILNTLKQIKERPGLSEGAKKKIDRKLARLERSRKEAALMERMEPVKPSIYRSGADASRRLARRADSGGRRLDVADPMKRSEMLEDMRRSRISAQGRRNTTEIAQRETLRSSGAPTPTDSEQEQRWQDYLDSLKIPDSKPRKVVEVETIEEAITALLDGHIVDMPDIEGAHTLLDELGRIVSTLEQMKENGEISQEVLENAVFDLCQVTVAGTSAFCLGNKGIPRYMMPQAEGTPIPGTRAARVFEEQKAKAIAEGKKVPKEVNGTEDFLAYLAAQGIKPRVDENGKEVGKETMPSDKLKATQRDMQGHKVVGMMESSKKGKFAPGEKPIFVSRDGYVVDGHHRWAAQLGQDFADGVLGNNHEMNVIVLDAPISEILRHANDWTDDFGIAKKTVAQKEDGGPTSRDILEIVKPKLVGEPNKIGQGIVKPANNSEARSLRSSGSVSIRSDGSGGRSSFRTRGVGASLRSSGATSGPRSTDAKISEGPQMLPNGLDSQNLPRVLSSAELEAKFGDSTRKHKRYFGRYGIKLKGDLPTDPVERESYYASLQALDDLFQNVNTKKLLKGQKLTVEINPTFMMSPGGDSLGEFNRSRRFFFSFGPQKSELRINTSGLRTKANELFQDAQRYRIVDGLEQQVLSDFVSRLFVNREALSAPDAENEIARRLTYASMIHELGHFLDYIATKDEDKVRWRSVMGSEFFGEQDVLSEEFTRGSMLSASMRDELNQTPSVSRYGAVNPQEKVAEGFTAWWLFSKRPDIRIMADAARSMQEPRQPVSSTMGETSARIVRGLLEELGPRVKSAKKPTMNRNSDDLPPLVTLYTMLPFMIVDGEKA